MWCISSLLAHYGRWSNITDGVYFCRRRGKPDANLFEERKSRIWFQRGFSTKFKYESITFVDIDTVSLVPRVRGLLALMALDLTKGICLLKRTR